MSILADFLTRNTITASASLPIVHTTPSYHLRSLRTDNRLVATKCEIFAERLNYFFVGRPAYKYESDSIEAPYWELPCCFIFDFKAASPIKRVFPFDSGAFAAKRYPSYINNFKLDDYEASNVADATHRIIGAFFGDVNSYFHLRPKSEVDFNKEFDPTVFDSELMALHRLSGETSPQQFDDRRFTIELQSTGDVDLTIENPLAIVVPLPYLQDKAFVTHIETVWKATPIGYPVYRFNVAAYYYAIYQHVDTFLKGRKFI